MRRFAVLALSSMALATVGLVGASPASGAERCYSIDARGEGTAPTPTTTTARIRGGGLLQGTTKGSFTLNADGTFSGPVEFTTAHGSVTVSLEGEFPSLTSFRGEGDITAATGRLSGATGSLVFVGDIVDDAGAFTETIRGEICVDLGR